MHSKRQKGLANNPWILPVGFAASAIMMVALLAFAAISVQTVASGKKGVTPPTHGLKPQKTNQTNAAVEILYLVVSWFVFVFFPCTSAFNYAMFLLTLHLRSRGLSPGFHPRNSL